MPKTRSKSTLKEQLQAIAHEYMIEFGVESFDMDEVADWAIRTGRYQRQPKSMKQRAKEEISRALRAERHIDPQGREVRTMHPVKGEQIPICWEWVDIRTAPPEKMRAALSYRRQAIAADVMRHKIDGDSYNDNNSYGAEISLFDYDFNKDVAEAELPKVYNEDEINLDLDEDLDFEPVSADLEEDDES